MRLENIELPRLDFPRRRLRDGELRETGFLAADFLGEDLPRRELFPIR
ncbi:hypothetical protein MUP77_03095 [Candidatus Bathyarchaeota archaeon]|nr:hypothetical protein [Candidatus Bathyarchaeota archaeon]